MKTFNLERFKKGRVWFNELPKCEYIPEKVLVHTVIATSSKKTIIRHAAIELLVPLGPRSMYALIGGEYRSDNSDTLQVELSVLDDGAAFFDSLASPGDVVKIGLPSEYVRGVIDGIDMGCAQLGSVGAGMLRITCAAHGVMWSSEAIYSKVASMLVKLINWGQGDVIDKEIVKLLSE